MRCTYLWFHDSSESHIHKKCNQEGLWCDCLKASLGLELSAFNLDAQSSLRAFSSGGISSALVPLVTGQSMGTNLVCVLYLPLQSTEIQLNPNSSGGLSSWCLSHMHSPSTLKNPGLAHHLAFLSSAHLLKPHILLPGGLYTTLGHERLGKMRRVKYGPLG